MKMKRLVLILVLVSAMFTDGCRRRSRSNHHEMRGQRGDMKIAREACAPHTNANPMVRRSVGARAKAGQSAAPCIPDEDAQRLSARIPSGMSSSERAQMAADTNSVKGKSEYGF